jgi:hypothetical protein
MTIATMPNKMPKRVWKKARQKPIRLRILALMLLALKRWSYVHDTVSSNSATQAVAMNLATA